MLTKERGPFSNIVQLDPAAYRHVYGTGGLFPKDSVGQMYTCAGGFIDFGHVRDVGDLTKFYYDALLLKRRKGEVIEPPREEIRGKITLLKDVPQDKQVDVARSVAYGEAVFHEIETYWQRRIGNHHSSFSPEDLVSNFFGTFLAGNALTFDLSMFAGDYNTRFAAQLELWMKRLGAVDSTATAAALDLVDTYWFKGSSLFSGYLLRRNFAVWPLHPWLVDGVPGCTSNAGAFPSSSSVGFAISPESTSYYSVEYKVPKGSRGPDRIDAEVVNAGQFGSLIQAIQTAAEREYGSDYASPAPVGRVGP